MTSEEPKVVAIRGGLIPVHLGEPVPDVVEVCRRFMAMAESGELRAISVAAVLQSPGDTETAASNYAHAANTGWALYAAIGLARRKFERYLDET